jgi:hypothetical protein
MQALKNAIRQLMIVLICHPLGDKPFILLVLSFYMVLSQKD